MEEGFEAKMVLRLFNTLGRRKEKFIPLNEREVRMYACGPTVYDSPHLGNLRTFVTVDILSRFLKFKGFRVTQVMNLTDVDDKTIRGSRDQGIPLENYTEKYIDAFHSDLKKLRIIPADEYPRATRHINDMVQLIGRLKRAGYAYQTNGSVYFSISKLGSYGALSGLEISELSSANRVDSDEYDKEQAHDFALWKGWAEEDGEIYWDTELGRGRPGWHVECSAMSMRFLGSSFDIHLGGVDLIFPHHENEIAQSEGATGSRFVRYWVHVEHLLVEGKKMAKSLGNYYTLGDLIGKGYDPLSIRYLLFASNYRDQLNFTFGGLKQARASVNRLQDTFHRLASYKSSSKHNTEAGEVSDAFMIEFESALDDDLNMPSALGRLFEYVKKVNKYIDNEELSEKNRDEIRRKIEKIDSVLALIVPAEVQVTEEIKELLEERESARMRGNWDEADRIRRIIESKGYQIEDSERGPRLIAIKGTSANRE